MKQSSLLLQNIKTNLPVFERLLKETGEEWGYEDPVYRFYHGSFKVYFLQRSTLAITEELEKLMPDRPLNGEFLQIIKEGTGKVFDLSHNKEWAKHTRPILEAFFHARFFLQMVVKYGNDLDAPEEKYISSGWAALLHLYNLR